MRGIKNNDNVSVRQVKNFNFNKKSSRWRQIASVCIVTLLIAVGSGISTRYISDTETYSDDTTYELDGVQYVVSPTGTGSSADPYDAKYIKYAIENATTGGKGRTIFLPPRSGANATYWELKDEDANISVALSDLYLRGSNQGQTFIVGESGFNNNTNFFNVTGTYSKIRVELIRFQASVDYDKYLGFDCFHIDGGHEIKFVDCEIRGFTGSALNFTCVDNDISWVELRGNYLLACLGDEVVFHPRGSNWVNDGIITNNFIAGSIRLHGSQVHNLTIGNNVFKSFSSEGLYIFGSDNIDASGNVFRRNGYIHLNGNATDYAENVVITGANIYRKDSYNQIPIVIQYTKNATIGDSIFVNSADWDVRSWGNNIDLRMCNIQYDLTKTNNLYGVFNGDRIVFNGYSENVGDPNSAGEWKHHNMTGVYVRNTADDKIYLGNGTGFQLLN